MLLFRFVYCTHFPATYFEVGVPSGSIGAILVWETYATAQANKTRGLLLSTPCYRSLMNRQWGISTELLQHNSQQPKPGSAFLTQELPSSRNALTEKQVPSATDVHTASPAGEEWGPALAILPSDQFQCSRVAFHCWHPNGASRVRPCIACACAGLPDAGHAHCTALHTSRAGDCSPLYRHASMKPLWRPLG